jgi:allantoicase
VSSRQKSPPEFAHLVNLAEDLTGTFVLWASDDYFAEKENLVRPDAPRWDEDKYTDKGKWMDGWESQRRRTSGHDSCIIRLGTPGLVHGFVVDTTWFRGNAPVSVAVEGVVAPATADAAALDASDGWFSILEQTPVQPHTANLLPLAAPSSLATHVRLRIFPDGGVARLRVFGVVVPDERTFWRAGAVDVAAVENGGTVAAVSDEFFGPPSNLLLPGRGVNMGDGWETKRRRTPGSDWCVIKLGRRSVVDRVVLDTAFFKGNAPQAVVVEAIDDPAPTTETLRRQNDDGGRWSVLIGKTALVQHKSHVLEPERPMTVTHLRVHIFPHGGVNRLRVFGNAVDSAAEAAALAALSSSPLQTWLSFCGSKAWATAMKAAPPSSVRALFARAEEELWRLGEGDLLEAFAAHPKIGETKASASATAQSAAWSSSEQATAQATLAEATATELATLNEKYREKFGFIYIVFATGKSALLMLDILRSRLANDRGAELDNAAREQMKITRLRMENWLKSAMTKGE